MPCKSKLFRGIAAVVAFAFASAETASACTGILLRNADGSIVHGRTVEFGLQLDITYAVLPRNYNFTGLTPLGDGKKWTTKYGVLGAIVFGNLGVMDGLNEKGLAMGTFLLPDHGRLHPDHGREPVEVHVVDRFLHLDTDAVRNRR